MVTVLIDWHIYCIDRRKEHNRNRINWVIFNKMFGKFCDNLDPSSIITSKTVRL